jgi:hypothetical protein
MASDTLKKLQLSIDDAEQLLICCRSECRYALAVNNSQVTSHLRDKHQVHESDRKGLTRLLTTIYPKGFRNPAKLDPRPNSSDVHPQLRVYDGFSCRKCAYCTINYPELSRHMSKNHFNSQSVSRARIQDLYDDVYLQAWTNGSARRYWTVQKDGRAVRPVAKLGVEEHLRSTREREAEYMHAQEPFRESACVVETTMLTYVATSPWMERTRWHTTYQGARRDILLGLAEMPNPNRSAEGYIIDKELDVLSSRQDERRIAALMPVIDDMLDRCEETVRHTSRVLLRWLRSTRPQECSSKPFTLVALELSKRRYRRTFKRFFALVFRAYRMSRDVRRSHTGIRFTKTQLRQIRRIWDHAAMVDAERACDQEDTTNGEDEDGDDANSEDNDDDDDEEEEEEEEEDDASCESEDDSADEESESSLGSNGGMDELRELVFQLSMAFSTAGFTDGQPGTCLLVYFSGILGFSLDAQNFSNARKFNPCLSALVYIQRLLFLEYALPHRAYPHLGIARRSRLRQHQKFETMRLRFMTDGCPSALEELQTLRDFGRTIARTEDPPFLLRWSDDGQVVSYEGRFSLTMESYRGLARHFVDKAEALCDDLMFDLRPEINLASLKDDIVDARYGHSFVQKNGLAEAYLELSDRACTTRRGGLFAGGQWDWRAVFKYEKRADALAEMLAGGLHTACGQLPRAPELLGLECANGSSTKRGIYAWNGFLVYVVRHHKSKRMTNREFNVIRFLPVRLGHSLYKYLVYIRPFLDMLQRQRDPSRSVRPSTLLFRAGGASDKPWPAARLTAVLKKATAEVWGRPVNSQLLRQVSIGITEKHVKDMCKPFNRIDDKGPEADLNVVFAWQSGHRPLQRGTNYGLDGAFPTQMQPALLRAYEWASTRWHEFLRIASKVLKVVPSDVVPDDVRVVMRVIVPVVARSPPRPRLTGSLPAKRKLPSWHHQMNKPAKRRALPGPRIDSDGSAQVELEAQDYANVANKHFSILSEFRLIICRTCRFAVWPEEVKGHLMGARHQMKGTECAEIVKEIARWGNLAKRDGFVMPYSMDKPIPQLPLRQDGLGCRRDGCRYICSTFNGIQKHLGKSHGWTISGGSEGGRMTERQRSNAGERFSEAVETGIAYQRFFTAGQYSRYFRVKVQ